MENLVQQEIIRAVVNARNEGEDIKETIKTLAKEFSLTEFVIRGIIELSATYGLEKISGPIAEGKIWKPLDYKKAIRKLEDKIYRLEIEIFKLNRQLTRELKTKEMQLEDKIYGLQAVVVKMSREFEIRESSWLRREPPESGIREITWEPLQPQKHEIIPKKQILSKAHEVVESDDPEERRKRLKEKIDRARNRLERKPEGEKLADNKEMEKLRGEINRMRGQLEEKKFPIRNANRKKTESSGLTFRDLRKIER